VQRYGLTPTHWEFVCRAQLIERNGAKYLQPGAILELSRGPVKCLAGVFESQPKTLKPRKRLEVTDQGH
jgi:hypothetical protein